MSKFYLIQRGKFRDLKRKDYKSLTGRDGLINLDYMGYTEFEWGTIPASYRRILHDRENYIFHYVNDIKDYRGKILVIFCRKDKAKAIEKEMRVFMEQHYKLKTWALLYEQQKETFCYNKDSLSRTDFWWSVENDSDVSDWMCWFGMDKLTPFKNMIDYDYNEWWMQKTEEERKTEYEDALNADF